MKTKMKLFSMVVIVLSIMTTSCSKDGATGPTGSPGISGTDGQDGQDGQDGNANVMAFKYDLSTVSGTFFDQEIPELTNEVLNNYVILTYLKLDGSTGDYNPIPGTFYGIRHIVRFREGLCKLDFALVSTETAYSYPLGALAELRVILVEPTSISGKNSTTADLKKAGVNVDDYYAVMDFFGLDY